MRKGCVAGLLVFMVGCYQAPERVVIWSGPPPQHESVKGSAEDLIQLAIEKDRGAQGITRGSDALGKASESVRAWEDPELRARIGSQSGQEKYEMSARWSFPRPGEGAAMESVVASRAEQWRAEARWRRADLAHRLREVLIRRRFLLERVPLEKQLLELRNERWALAKKSAGLGVEGRAIAARERMDRAKQELRVQEAEDALAFVEEEASRLVGGSLPETVAMKPLQTLEVEEWLEVARAHPRIGRGDAEISRGEAELFLKERAVWPWLTFVELGHGFSTPTADAQQEVRVGLQVPLLGSERAEAEEARALKFLAEVQQETRVLEVQRSVVAALRRVKNARKRYRALKEESDRFLVDTKPPEILARVEGIELEMACVEAKLEVLRFHQEVWLEEAALILAAGADQRGGRF